MIFIFTLIDFHLGVLLQACACNSVVLQTRGSTLRDVWSSTVGESGKPSLSEKCLNGVLEKLRSVL